MITDKARIDFLRSIYDSYRHDAIAQRSIRAEIRTLQGK